MKTMNLRSIKVDRVRLLDIIEHNEYLIRQVDVEFVNRLNQAIDYASSCLEKLVTLNKLLK